MQLDVVLYQELVDLMVDDAAVEQGSVGGMAFELPHRVLYMNVE